MDLKAVHPRHPRLPAARHPLPRHHPAAPGPRRRFRFVVDRFTDEYRDAGIDAIVAIESRGFLFGAPLACNLGIGFVPVRKAGKLPAKHMSVEYSLEYGKSQLDIHEDALKRGQKALIVDDLLATGGTANAAAKLVELLGAKVHAWPSSSNSGS